MKNRYLFVVFFLFMFQGWGFAQTGSIKGRVYNITNNEPIPYVNIIINGKPEVGTTSDLNGEYLISGIQPGYTRLIASFLGYEKHITEDVLVTRVHAVQLDIPMKEVAVSLKEVEIRAAAFVRKIESPVSLQTLSIQEIEKNPGANRDISRVIQSLPGVASSPNYRNDVIVRGGGASENRFYLDGVEIPNLNHFATQGSSGGPVGIINADFIREVDFYAGAFPANRGNALSSVIEFRQSDGNQDSWGFHGSVGATDMAFTTEGPLGLRSNLLFSVRRSYLKFLFDIIGLPFLPTYNDYQLKYKWNIDKKNQFTLISIGSLDQSKLNTGIKNPDESQRYILGYLPENDQWSYTIGGVFRHFRTKGSDLYVISRNMLDNRAYKYENNIRIPSNQILNYRSQEIENKLRYEAIRERPDWKWNFGANLEYAKYSNKTFQKSFINNELQSVSYTSSFDLWKYGVFGQFSRNLADNRLNLSVGLRTDANNYSSQMSDPLGQLSPRFSLSYALGKDVSLNFNTGRYYQQPAYTTLGYRDSTGRLVNKTNKVRFIEADHLVTGIEYRPNPESRLSLEGFYKVYNQYPLSVLDSISLASKGAEYGTFGDEAVFSSSRGRAYGLELLFRDKNLKGFNLLASFTLVRSMFTDAAGKYLPSSWDNKILFNTTISRSLKKNWDIGLKWRYVGGAPYTPYDLEKSSLVEAWDVRNQGYIDYQNFNSRRLGSFQQLDVRVDKSYFFKDWSLMLYLDIQNVYNFQSDQQDFIVNYNDNGQIETYTDPNGVLRYKLRSVANTSGTVLPTLGIMIQF